jgi:hypothetical protein
VRLGSFRGKPSSVRNSLLLIPAFSGLGFLKYVNICLSHFNPCFIIFLSFFSRRTVFEPKTTGSAKPLRRKAFGIEAIALCFA